VSLASATFGGLLGFALAYAAVIGGLPQWIRPTLMTFSGVASNFAGLPLAFAFLATLGRTGLVTTLLVTFFDFNIYSTGFNLLSFWGLTLTYLYFQIPLMVLIITPALDGLKREWREASAILGASYWEYWRYVALPILWPAIIGTTLLLFANSFGAIATAYALTGSSLNIVTILLYAQIRGDVLHDPNLGYALALGMILVTGLSNGAYIWLRAPQRPVAAMKQAKLGSWIAIIVGSLYFIVPLIGTFEFSMRMRRGEYSFAAYRVVFADPNFQATFAYSTMMALATIVIGVVLVVPTSYWIQLRLQKLRPLVEFITLMPLVIPAIVIVFGYLRLYNSSSILPMTASARSTDLLLAFSYVTLALPYMYRAVDTGMRAIDVRTLTEAAENLGAGWPTVLFRVILPNVRVAILSGAFLTFATVIGEFTMASLLNRPAFGPYLQLIGANRAYEPSALAVIAFVVTWACMGLINVVGRGKQIKATP